MTWWPKNLEVPGEGYMKRVLESLCLSAASSRIAVAGWEGWRDE